MSDKLELVDPFVSFNLAVKSSVTHFAKLRFVGKTKRPPILWKDWWPVLNSVLECYLISARRQLIA